MKHFTDRIAIQLQLKNKQVDNTLQLLQDGATVHFIARYRKERTGGLDELQIRDIGRWLKQFTELEERKKFILDSILKQGKLTKELEQSIRTSEDFDELEDLYLPFKTRKKTRADLAREAGLQPLADLIFDQKNADVYKEAVKYVNAGISSVQDALHGARDIIAERINEDQEVRKRLRVLFDKEAFVFSKVYKSKEMEAGKYKDYFDYKERLATCPSHRFLAVMRGEKEKLLKVSVNPDDEKAIEQVERFILKSRSPAKEQMQMAIEDAYNRLLKPSLENEYINKYKIKADEEAIKVFAENLRQLLLAPPLGGKRVLAIDPGYRTGCKIVCLDENGNLLHNETIYPHAPQDQKSQSASKINTLVNMYKTEAIAIGNGTASRETEYFIKKIKFEKDIQVYVVNESGASVYSASPVAREEFPQFDVTVRGAVSIGRRLMDPLAELIKIDPQSIGVGQYQHDVDQALLKQRLIETVEGCVNSVGVDLNTASLQLLMHVSGIGTRLAKNIVEYRKVNGSFQTREELKKVPALGKKAFEQCSGFLRIRNGLNFLDNTAVHPESYGVVVEMAKELRCKVEDLVRNESMIKSIQPEKYINEERGVETLKDIMDELSKPGRDIRGKIKLFEFAKGINKMEQLEPGMVLPGIITNITRFGVFVDIGVKQNGLIHVSQLSDEFITDPNQVVKLHQHIQVKVLEVDASRKRIQLTLKDVNNN